MAKKKEKKLAVGRIDNAEEKKKALSAALQHLEKDFGQGAIMRLGDDKVEDVEVIPTVSIGLDLA